MTHARGDQAAHARRPVPAAAGREALAVRRWWLIALLLLGLVVMVGPFVWMLLGSFKTQRELHPDDADVAAREPDDRQLHAALRPARLPPLLLELDADRRGDHARESALLLDDRATRSRSSASPGRNLLFVLVLGDAARAGERDARPAVRPDGEARPRRHLLGGDPPGGGRAVRRLPDAPVHARHPGRAARGRPRRRRERVHIFWKIVLPLSAPALAALAILTFLPAGTHSCGRSSC